MADLKTTVTELVTGLGMTGIDTIDAALSLEPPSMVSVSPERWKQLRDAYEGGALQGDFASAFANGRAFFEADDGLRTRVPKVIEWKGAQKASGDENLPVDLRIDHVFLISCKYMSKILHNASPQRVFEHALRNMRMESSVDWFHHVAPDEYNDLYQLSLIDCGIVDAPSAACDLSTADRTRMKEQKPPKWAPEVEDAYAVMCRKVSEVSARLLNDRVRTKAEQLELLRRFLRFGQAPYFVLGSSANAKETLRVRVATPWDWNQQFELRGLHVEPKSGGQPIVGWEAVVRNRHTAQQFDVVGHIEIRWSHGRFGGKPEAKVYLDTPHAAVPGYFPLT